MRTGALATRILIRGGSARGVSFHSGSRAEEVLATREVILCGGAINTPQLLMLSGVGAAEHLRACGIEVVHDLPGVGANLQEHPDVILGFATTRPVSIARLRHPWRRGKAGLQWLLTRGGIAASSIYEVGGFYRSDDSVPRSNLQVHVAPIYFEESPRGLVLAEGYSVHISQLRPREPRGGAPAFLGPLRSPCDFFPSALPTKASAGSSAMAFADCGRSCEGERSAA